MLFLLKNHYICAQILILTQTTKNKMKKLFTVLFIAGAMSIVACGPNAEEKAKQEAESKAKMDSLFNAASQSVSTSADSTAHADSTATPAAPATEEKK
ncbi:MAG TPA: hypothetical protein VFF27_18470 [Bacteroidia bacterium]|jgi:hypothetical protein|nr:hypothetical protein [Bacteroidia bacterium]